MTDDLFTLAAARNAAMDRVAHNAGEVFRVMARSFVLRYLSAHGEASSEDITDSAIAAGIVPHNSKAFGPVYAGLSREGMIVKAGFCARKKGHLTAGGILWRLPG